MRKVAIVAASYRMPGTTPSRFWEDLLAGRDLVTEIDPSRFATSAFLHPDKRHPGTSYTFAAGSIGDISGFDAGFFAISPREASLMDPQQRLLLEMSWEAFENAGIPPSSLRGSDCGVFIGISTSDYSSRMADDLAAIDASFATGNTASIAANRLSYVYDLRGPSMAIDTACSSSLVAFHQACRSIASGEITQALAGAVSLHLHPLGFISFSKASMLSRQGRCRVFDASADGYVRSEGGGVFLLKDFDRAVADGNPILAAVLHSSVNTDGRKSGLTVPSVAAQAALLANAYADAGIEPHEIDYIEAHGTGTAVGDPIEARALGEALGQHRPKSDPLRIGSVKGNVGHLEAASGVAGLVKALYCLRHRVIPAHIGMTAPNPHIPFDDLNLKVPTSNEPLRAGGRLVIGVNSFGFGGANAHLILENFSADMPATPAVPKASALPIVVSARDANALAQTARDMARFLSTQPQSALYDIAHQSVFGRERHTHCAVLFGTTPAGLAQTLERFADQGSARQGSAMTAVECGTALANPVGAAFVYSGNGAQWAGMGSLLLADATFRAAVREVDRLFSRYADYSLEEELAGKNGDDRYEFTEFAQPALFALQVGMTAMLRRRGLVPVAVAGHSVGEVAAAWASGSLSLAAAVSVIHHRSSLQGTTRGSGGMTAVNIAASPLRDLLEELGLGERLSVAGINSAKSVTVAGPLADLELLERRLDGTRVAYKRLGLDYAFHSAAMDRLFPELRRALAHLEPEAGEVPFYSTVTGEQLNGKSLNAEYWWRNVREPVLFEPAIGRMIEEGINIFVEIGPHAVLRRYIQDCLADAGAAGRIMSTGVRGDDSAQRVYSGLSQALIAGATMDWKRLLPWRGRHVRLPNYPWQRENCWHDVTAASIGLLTRRSEHPLLGCAIRQSELTWENVLDTVKIPLLADHVIDGSTVFPGSGFAELALAMAARGQPGTVMEIEDLEIRAPLLLAEDASRTLRCAVDSRDGQLSIKSRDQLGTESWVLHVVGRVLREPTGMRLQPPLEELPAQAAHFTGAGHTALTLAAGLQYGPGFRAVSHGWIDGAQALAVLEVPDSLRQGFDEYHLHPALLDCVLQLIIQLLRADAADHEGVIFVPTRIGRLTHRGGPATPRYARARLRNRGPHSVLAEFEIFDEARRPIARLEEVRFRAIRVQRAAAEPFRWFEYVGVPRPLPAAAGPAPAAAAWVARAFPHLETALDECLAAEELQRAQRLYACEVDPLLDELCHRFATEALPLVPVPAVDATPYHAHLTAAAGNGAAPDAARETEGSAQDIWNTLIGDYPDYFEIVHAAGSVGLHLAELLHDRRTLDQVMPAQASLPNLLRRAQGSAFENRIGAVLRAQIGAALDMLPEGRRLEVVEISEGAPKFAAAICRTLDFDCADYRFVSSQASSLEEAQRLRETYPQMGVTALETAAAGAVVAGAAVAGAASAAASSAADPRGGTSQLVLLMLDFSSLRDALRAFDHARAQLAPGGKLLVIGQHPSRWLDFVFGRDPQWWSDAQDGTPLSRQQPAGFWRQHAIQAGFSSLRLLQPDAELDVGPYLMIGSRDAADLDLPAAVLPRRWLLLADAAGYSAQLALAVSAQLQQRGIVVSALQAAAAPGMVATPGVAALGAAMLATSLEECAGADGALDGIVDLRGLRRPAMPCDAEALLDAQVARCAGAAALIKACETTHLRTLCCFVTADAATHLLPPRRGGGAPAAMQGADAPLAGLARTLMNEAAGCTVRWVDLETAAPIEITAAALARELELTDGEQEVVITAAGERYAPRLRPAPPPAMANAEEPAPPPRSMRLDFTQAGQLRNLQWQSQPRVAPVDDEVEVAVEATGLNFRDVMYALGLLSDEAVENGFAGSSLGLEFSGVVLRVGPAAAGVVPGDAVVGFAPSSFGDRVVTRAGALSRIPPGLSFEAAATIPSAFFTAYYALHHLARLQAGEKVLIHGAAGGVGIAAIQVAKWCGAEIYATAGSDEKRDFLHLLGIEHIFDSRKLDFAERILELTGGEGVDVVLNSLAGEAINRNLQALKPFGRFLELGKRDFYENTRVGLRPFRNNLSYFGIDADQLMLERPELTRRLFGEVLTLFRQRELRPLPFRTFEAAEVVDAFRCMQQSRHIGKIVVTYRNGVGNVAHAPRPPASRKLTVSPESTVLVTGGLGGFGLRTAEWLADRGARHLVLVGRRGAVADEAKTVLARLERRGVHVLARACDITDRQALAALLEDMAGTLPPLRGVVHAAVVIEDGLVRDSTPAAIRRVLAPKVLGARYLHELTRHLPLDFFVLYSSATTLFGNPGQGSYVAANFALEALARERRSQGLAATCIGWGAIADVGFLARNPKIGDALRNRMGGSPLQSSVALDALESLLTADRSDLGVLDLDWATLGRSLPSGSSPKFAELRLRSTEAKSPDEGNLDLRRLLLELPEAEAQAAVMDLLRVEIGEILRMAPDKIDTTLSMQQMGLDSLMGVELMVAVENRFGARLPAMALADGPTVAKLAAWIAQNLRGEESGTAAQQEIRAQIAKVAGQHASDMAAEEIDQLARQLRTGGGAGQRMIH